MLVQVFNERDYEKVKGDVKYQVQLVEETNKLNGLETQ